MSSDDQCRLPTREELERASQLLVYDEHGESRTFGSLWDCQEQSARRQVIVFIRHFFCGSCQEYVRSLSRDLPPDSPQLQNPPSKLMIIGCGDHALLTEYINNTGCKFQIYSDPTRALYDTLGMTCSFALGEKPDYIQKSFISSTLAGMWDVLSSPTANPGKKNQNGGEFIWLDGEIKWARRMRNTRDHTEINDLKGVLDSQKDIGKQDSTSKE